MPALYAVQHGIMQTRLAQVRSAQISLGEVRSLEVRAPQSRIHPKRVIATRISQAHLIETHAVNRRNSLLRPITVSGQRRERRLRHIGIGTVSQELQTLRGPAANI